MSSSRERYRGPPRSGVTCAVRAFCRCVESHASDVEGSVSYGVAGGGQGSLGLPGGGAVALLAIGGLSLALSLGFAASSTLRAAHPLVSAPPETEAHA